LGIPSIYDRVCQQALLNRLEPIFEPVFDEANFGYRVGGGEKVCHFGGQKAPVEWLRRGWRLAQGCDR
jgi:hypothetical protein